MELIPQVPAGRQVIERYAASGFRVSGAVYLGPVLVFPDRTEAWAEPAFTAEGLAPVLAHGGVELLLLGFGRRIAPVEHGIAQRPESRRDQGRADGYRGGLPHLQYAGGRGPPRRRRAVAASLNRRHAICGGRGTTGWSPPCCPILMQVLPLFSASAIMVGRRSIRGRDGGSSAGKGACPRMENTAARDRLSPSGARRGVGDQLSRICGRAA